MEALQNELGIKLRQQKAEYPLAVERLLKAIEAARKNGYLGDLWNSLCF